MARFRIDFHVHTSVSPDGLDTPEAVVASAKRRGLDGLVVTDHDRCGGFTRLVRAGLADESGRAVDGFLVLPGTEVSTNQGHVLVIGGGIETPARAGGWEAEEIVAHARQRGWLTVAPHAFDRCRSGVGRSVLERVRFDGVEVFNSKSFEPRSNAKAREFAFSRSLPMLGGSDAHHAGTVGRAHTVVHARELNGEAVLEAVRLRRTVVHEGVHTPGELVDYWKRGCLSRRWMSDLAERVAWRRKGSATSPPVPEAVMVGATATA